jgi:hypothetical protein
MVNVRFTEAALYVGPLLTGCPWATAAVIVHGPAAVTETLAVPVVGATAHVPVVVDEKLTGSPELEVALTVNPLPYCKVPDDAKLLMVCDCRFEVCGRIMIVPVTGVAAL